MLATLESPPNWDEVFGRSGPLELEIGCGAGGFALEYCRRNPNTRYVAFEWRKKFAREVQHRCDRLGLTNLKIIEGDARTIVPRIFAPASLDVVHLQFPDPWWKRAQQKRAILLPGVVAMLMGLIKPMGQFEYRTDVEDRALSGLKVLETAGFINPQGPGVFHAPLPDEVPSTRERRYLATGQPVFRARLLKPVPLDAAG